MTMLERLLDILLREMIDEEKINLTHSLCMNSLTCVGYDELEPSKTNIKSEDGERYYVNVTMKNGTEMTVPLKKRYYRYGKRNGRTVS